MILLIIGLSLSFVAIGVLYYLGHQQNIHLQKKHDKLGVSLLALQKEFTQYQVNTNRTNKELNDAIIIKAKEQDKNLNKLAKELPLIIRKVVGHIEFAKPLDKQ